MGFRLDGRVAEAAAGDVIELPAGGRRDWWNAGETEAVVRVEVRPALRFEEMILNAFGLAQDGKVNARGMPGLLQLSLFAREFSDVVVFTRPPVWVQRVVFGVIGVVARCAGYRGSYPEYLARGPSRVVEVEALQVEGMKSER